MGLMGVVVMRLVFMLLLREVVVRVVVVRGVRMVGVRAVSVWCVRMVTMVYEEPASNPAHSIRECDLLEILLPERVAQRPAMWGCSHVVQGSDEATALAIHTQLGNITAVVAARGTAIRECSLCSTTPHVCALERGVIGEECGERFEQLGSLCREGGRSEGTVDASPGGWTDGESGREQPRRCSLHARIVPSTP